MVSFSTSPGFLLTAAAVVALHVTVATIVRSSTFESVAASLKASLRRRRGDVAIPSFRRETSDDARELHREFSSTAASASSDSGDSYDSGDVALLSLSSHKNAKQNN